MAQRTCEPAARPTAPTRRLSARTAGRPSGSGVTMACVKVASSRAQRLAGACRACDAGAAAYAMPHLSCETQSRGTRAPDFA